MDFTGIGSAIGGVASAVGSYYGAKETNEMQHQMMLEQQQFQERMSNTAYQRASTDMKAAGLNPMMMTNGGMNASSPQGATASPVVKSGIDADSIQKAIATALNVSNQAAQVKNIEADTDKKKAETITEFQRPGSVDADVAWKRALERETGQKEQRLKDTRPVVLNEAITAANEAGMHSATRKVLDQVAYGTRRGSEILRPVSDFFHSAKNVNGMIRSWQ